MARERIWGGISKRLTSFLLALGALAPGVQVGAQVGATVSSPNSKTDRKVRVLVAGDVLAHTRVKTSGERNSAPSTSAYSFLFEPVKDIVAGADVAFANLETPVSKSQPNRLGGFTFNAPSELLGGLKWAGFDVLSVANNHSLDQKLLGLSETVEAVRSEGLIPLGADRSREAALDGHVQVVRGLKIGFLAFTDFINGGEATAAASRNPYVSLARRSQDLFGAIDQMRKRADVVILSLHWGVEYESKPRPWQEKMARELHERGVDVLVGHHPHVLQPIRWSRTKSGRRSLTIYSLGNFISNQASGYAYGQGSPKDALKRDGVLVELHLDETGIRAFRPHPIWTANWQGLEEGIQTISIPRELERLREKIAATKPSPERSFLLAQEALLLQRMQAIATALELKKPLRYLSKQPASPSPARRHPQKPPGPAHRIAKTDALP